MDANTILIILIAIITLDFALERVLSFLNRKQRKKPLPSELAGIYDEEKYLESQRYQDDQDRFSNFSATFSFILLVAVLLLGGFGVVDGWVRNFAGNELLVSLFFFGVLFVISDVISLPFQLYETFVLEAKYGFNKTTPKTFILDKLKGYVLGILLGGVILVSLISLIFFMGSDFWIYFWGVITVFSLFINMFYTSLIVPLFNKLQPLEEGELKDAITDYSTRVKFPLNNIFIIDGSKRSSKGNAFFSGIGKKKKIVLYDTLVNNHNIDELVSILAHEVGHFKKKHVIYMMVANILQTGLMLYLLSLMIYNLEVSVAMGGTISSIHLNILAFFILYTPVTKLFGIIMNLFSRKNEYEADAYAVQTYKKLPLMDALKKLTTDHLSNLTPHPWYVFIHYSHPTLFQRITAIKSLQEPQQLETAG